MIPLFVYRLWLCHAICNLNRVAVEIARAHSHLTHSLIHSLMASSTGECAVRPINFHWIIRSYRNMEMEMEMTITDTFELYVLFRWIFQIKSFHKFSIKLIRNIRIYYPDDLHCILPFVIRPFSMYLIIFTSFIIWMEFHDSKERRKKVTTTSSRNEGKKMKKWNGHCLPVACIFSSISNFVFVCLFVGRFLYQFQQRKTKTVYWLE